MRKSRFSQTSSDDCLVRRSLGHSNSQVRSRQGFRKRAISQLCNRIAETQILSGIHEFVWSLGDCM